MMKALVLFLLSCVGAVTVCRAQDVTPPQVGATTAAWSYQQVQTINGRKNSFKSPNYYGPYVRNSNITYFLNISNPQRQRLRVVFRFQSFDVEDCGSVCCDKLKLGGQDYCGNLAGQQVIIVTDNNFIKAEFTSDSNKELTGFLIRYDAYPVLSYSPGHVVCNQVTSQMRGVIVSPNYPYYVSNTSCSHTLNYNTSSPYTVRFRFRDFGFRGGIGCPSDYITVPDLTSSSKYCGPDTPNHGAYFDRTSYNGVFDIKSVFGVYPVAGYVIEFEAWPGFPSDRPTTAASVPPSTNIPYLRTTGLSTFCPPRLLTSAKGSFSSPRYGYGGYYPNNLSCYYNLDVDVGANRIVVELNLRHFDVEGWATCGSNCACDYLQLPASYLGSNMTRLCGRHENDTNKAFLMEGTKATMLFKTDGDWGEAGFNIDYAVYPISEPESGTQSSIDDILSSSSYFSSYLASPGYFSKRNPGNCSLRITNPSRRLFSLYVNAVDDKQTPGYSNVMHMQVSVNGYLSRFFAHSRTNRQFQTSGDIQVNFEVDSGADLYRYPGTIFKFAYVAGPLTTGTTSPDRTTPTPWRTTNLLPTACPPTLLTSATGRFSSPGLDFGGRYSNRLSCDYHLDVDVGANLSVVELNMATFDVERCGYSCGCDSLKLPGPAFGINNNGTLCGEYNGTTTGFLMEGSKATMRFKTDGSVSKAGFDIKYIVHPVSETQCGLQGSVDNILSGTSSYSFYFASPGYFSKRNPGNNCSLRIANPSRILYSIYLNSVDDKQTPGYRDMNQITVNGHLRRFFGYSKISLQYQTSGDITVDFMINSAADLYRYPGTVFKITYVRGHLSTSTSGPFYRTTPYPWMTTHDWQNTTPYPWMTTHDWRNTTSPRRSLIDMLRELAWRARQIRDNLDSFANLIDQTANRAATSGLGAADALVGFADLLGTK